MNPSKLFSKNESNDKIIFSLSNDTKNIQSTCYFTKKKQSELPIEISDDLKYFRQTNSEPVFREYYY